MDSADLAKLLRGSVDFGNNQYALSFSGDIVETGNRKIGAGFRVAPSNFSSESARLVFSATPDDQHRWLVDFHYVRQPDTPRVDELVPGFGQLTPSSSEFQFKPNERLFAHLRHDAAESWLGLDWRFDLAWQRIQDDRVSRNYLSPIRRIERNRSDLLGFSANVRRESGNTTWIAGVEAYDDTVRSARFEEDLVSGMSAEVVARFPDDSSLSQIAVYGNIVSAVSDKSTLSGGLRFAAVDVDVAATAMTTAANVEDRDVSADIGWIYSLGGGWQFSANAAYGFRAPNIFDIGTLGERPGNRFNIPNTDLSSETVVQVDAGLRHSGENFRFEVVAYTLEYDDRITSVSTGMQTPAGRDIVQSVNAADASIRGLEFGTNYRLADNFAAQAVLNYTWGRQRVTGQAAEPADRIPPISGSISLTGQLGENWSFDSWLKFAGLQDRLSQRDSNDPRIDPNGTPGWGILGARMDWQVRPDIALSFGIDNVFDRDYRRHGSGIDASGRNFSFAISAQW